MTGHAYTLKVTFTREISEDLDLLETQRRCDPRLNWRAAAIKQFTKELQDAYDGGDLGGYFKVDDCDLLYGEDAEADAKFKEAFPEVTRWGEVADDARIILEFLDWARSATPSGLRDVEDGSLAPQELVYEFYEIDEHALEADRRRLYETLRKNPWPVVVTEKKEG